MEPVVHLDLFVQRDAVPICGWLAVEGQPREVFAGYLEFLALLERVVGPREPVHGGGEGGPSPVNS